MNEAFRKEKLSEIKKDDRFQYGDLIATRDNSLLSCLIRWFMKRQDYTRDNFSHIAVVINLWNEIWIAEAVARGVVVHSLRQSGYDTHQQLILLRHKKGFSEEQIKNLSLEMVRHAGIRYQFSNIILWAVKIGLKIDFLKPVNEKRVYCSELAAIAINAAYPGTFTSPNETSPADQYTNKIYDIVDINHILSDKSSIYKARNIPEI